MVTLVVTQAFLENNLKRIQIWEFHNQAWVGVSDITNCNAPNILASIRFISLLF